MATIRLTQIDGKFPNLALMKLSHWHKSQGHKVVFEKSIVKGLFEPEYDIVYGSAIFSTSAKKIEQFKANFPTAIIGGTGTNDNSTTVERIKQFLYEEICERRPDSSSKMCEEVLKFIEQMDNN